jgi:hypothetical protein
MSNKRGLDDPDVTEPAGDEGKGDKRARSSTALIAADMSNAIIMSVKSPVRFLFATRSCFVRARSHAAVTRGVRSMQLSCFIAVVHL